MQVVASLSQGRTAAAQCGLFTQKTVPVIFEPPCNISLHFWYNEVLFRQNSTEKKIVVNNIPQNSFRLR